MPKPTGIIMVAAFDFPGEVTLQSFSGDYEYVVAETSSIPVFSAARVCAGQIPATPGKSIFIRLKGTGSFLPSDYVEIPAPARLPVIDVFGPDAAINYVNETVMVTSPPGIFYEIAKNAAFTLDKRIYAVGTGAAITPGESLYLRYQASNDDKVFASDGVMFVVPVRPRIMAVPRFVSGVFEYSDTTLKFYKNSDDISTADLIANVNVLSPTVGDSYHFFRPAKSGEYFRSEIVTVQVK